MRENLPGVGGRQQFRLDNVRFKGITRENNEMLVGTISKAEVKEAVWNCDSSKSPRPDGFNFGFIKFCWDIIKGDVMSAVQSFAEGGSWLKGTNASFITLVPKVVNPTLLNDFRPISLVVILPVDLAQERCLVTNLLTSLTPRALQVHTTESLSKNLKTQDGASAAGGALTLKSVTRTPKNSEKIYSAEPY